MIDKKTLDDFKKLDAILKKFSRISDNRFVQYPTEDTFYELPSEEYFEIIQRVFDNGVDAKALNN